MLKQKIATYLLIGLLSLGSNVLAQKHTIIIYRYNQDSIKINSYYKPLYKILGIHSFGESDSYKRRLISFNQQKGYSETINDFTVKDTSCAIMGDGLFGHEIFVVPGDTILVNINGLAPRQINNHYIPWGNNLNYEGKNKFIYSLFDSLAIATGELRTSSMSYKPTDKLNAFCETANNVYKQQCLFLKQYCNRHTIGNPYKELAKAEIDASYINNLLSPLNRYDSLTINDYSKPYRETLLSYKFNNQYLYFNSSIYSNTAYAFSALVLPTVKPSRNKRDIDLKLVYETIKLNYSDSIRDHLLTCHLSYFLSNPTFIYPSFDSLLTDFKNICKNHVYTHLLDSLNVARKALGVKKYSLKEAMASQIVDSKSQQLNIKQLFRSKPLLIICWASWCAPCLREIPSEKKMQDLYGDKIDFIYLSFDKSRKLWQDKLKTLSIKDGNNYLLTDYFTSDFAHFYNIVSIPYYLLYDKNGNKVEIKDLRPSNDGFKSVLEKLIK